jgi:hypothetical protein
VQRLVEANYVGGRPRHHLPSAHNPELEDGASIFFIVDHVQFSKMTAREIQAIARHRNIIVRNVPQRHFEWDHETLSEFGDLSRIRDIQGK